MILVRKVKVIGAFLGVVAIVGVIAFGLMKFNVIELDFLEEIFFNKKEKAEAIVLAMEEKDIEKINNIIFQENELVVDEELEDMFNDEGKETQDEDLISKILVKDSIKLNKVKKDVIEYEVSAPNLENIFKNIGYKDMSEEEFSSYIYDYIDSAEFKTTTVEVPYTISDKQMIIDYKDKDFINSITGGLLGAYQGLYQNMIDEYNAKE